MTSTGYSEEAIVEKILGGPWGSGHRDILIL